MHIIRTEHSRYTLYYNIVSIVMICTLTKWLLLAMLSKNWLVVMLVIQLGLSLTYCSVWFKADFYNIISFHSPPHVVLFLALTAFNLWTINDEFYIQSQPSELGPQLASLQWWSNILGFRVDPSEITSIIDELYFEHLFSLHMSSSAAEFSSSRAWHERAKASVLSDHLAVQSLCNHLSVHDRDVHKEK